jgi:hypothetical protein
MGLEKPSDLIRQPPTPQIRAPSSLPPTLRATKGWLKTTRSDPFSWTQRGTEDFLVRYKRKGLDLLLSMP